MKKVKLGKQKILATAKKQLEKTLLKTGYIAIKSKYGKVEIDRFPDLKVDNSHLPKLSNGIGNGYKVHTGANHPDAKQFPIGNSHKQGYELIYSKEYATQMNGKKT